MKWEDLSPAERYQTYQFWQNMASTADTLLGSLQQMGVQIPSGLRLAIETWQALYRELQVGPPEQPSPTLRALMERQRRVREALRQTDPEAAARLDEKEAREDWKHDLEQQEWEV